MPVDIEVRADEWEAYQRDMASMQEELYQLWVRDMEEDYA